MGGLRAYIYFPSLYILPDQRRVNLYLFSFSLHFTRSTTGGNLLVTDKIFYSVDFCITHCLNGRIYRCIVSCPATTTTPITESIAGNPSTSILQDDRSLFFPSSLVHGSFIYLNCCDVITCLLLFNCNK